MLSGILLLTIAVGLRLAREAAALSTCAESGPADERYSVVVCITAPANGASLEGNQPVQGTISVTGSDPGVQSLTFFLDGAHLITDFHSQYTFILPTAHWVDGPYQLAVEAAMRDGFRARRPRMTATFANGVTTPPVNTATFTPAQGTRPAQGQPFVLAATGDGASGGPGAATVTAMIDAWAPNMFLYLGDVYANGSATEFANWYAPDQYFGRFREITNPTIGNHEYQTNDAKGYFTYWDNVPDYYSVDAAGWHIISLNSNRPRSWDAQEQWLRRDLQQDTSQCTLVFYHHPLFSIGSRDGDTRPEMLPVWELLDEMGVDVVLTGHDHNYQRWKPLNGDGELDPAGITQFVVGTGGHGVQRLVREDHRVAASDATEGNFGALRMELNPRGASYQYLTVAGTEDSGAIACDGLRDTAPPAAPTGLTATIGAEGNVALSWDAASDAIGVSGYEVYRDGELLATIGAVRTYVDTTVSPATSYTYQLRATDAGQHVSEPSGSVAITTPVRSLQFRDDFESGTLEQWTLVTGPMRVQQEEVASGGWAARATSTGEAAYASRTLATPETDLSFRVRFKLLGTPTDNIYLARFRTEADRSILGLYVSDSSGLSLRNDVAGGSLSSGQAVSAGEWHDIQVHLRIDPETPEAGQVEVWYNGARVPELSTTQDVGTAPVGRLQLGENARGRTFDVAFDDVVVDAADRDRPSVAPAATPFPAATPAAG